MTLVCDESNGRHGVTGSSSLNFRRETADRMSALPPPVRRAADATVSCSGTPFVLFSQPLTLAIERRKPAKSEARWEAHGDVDRSREGERILNRSENVDQVYAPYGILLLRVTIGIDWLVHAFLKVSRGMNTHEALLAKNGITSLLAWPTFSLEVIGGVAIILGWYSRQWAAFLLFFLATVVWIKWPVGWTYSNTGGGWEYPLFWLFAQAALVLCGDGAFALSRGGFRKKFK
jgi:putative oxidoreductase